jgi:hypothetical protein
MTDRHRPCAVPDCPQTVFAPNCLCAKHWKLIGQDLRYRILSSQVHGEDSPEFIAAKSAAVEAVAKAEGRREPALFPDFQTEVMG